MNILKMKLRSAGMLRLMDESGGDGGDGGGGQQQQQQQQQSSGLSAEDQQLFDQWKAEKKKENEQDREKSAFDKMREKQQNETSKIEQEKQMRADVAFDMSFDQLVADSGLFKATAEHIRKGVEGLDGGDKVHVMKCLALTDFFDKSENLDLLMPADQVYIKNKVIGQHEKNVNSVEAWSILEQALHTAERMKLNSNKRKGGGADSSTPKLNAFIENAKNKMRGIKATTQN